VGDPIFACRSFCGIIYGVEERENGRRESVWPDSVPSPIPPWHLHVGLNAHLLSLGRNYRGAGINGYIYNLLRHLPQVGGHYRYTAFLSEHRFSPEPPLAVRLSRLPTAHAPVRIFWEQAIQPVVLQRARVDLLHAMAFVSPLLLPCPTVVTVYDLSFLRFPGSFRPLNRFYLRQFTSWSVRRAHRVLAISESTRQDVIRLLGKPAEQVDVVHCGVDKRFYPRGQAAVAAFRRKKGLPERFILFLGTLEPRKNVVSLLEAYAQLSASNVGSWPVLVIAGAKGWFYEDIFAAVERLDLTERVIFSGYVPEEEKPLWYNAAELFVYPSLFEGFGLPPLEAMACGTPVIVCNTSSLPEVVGDAGIKVPPGDVSALAQAIAAMLHDQAGRAAWQERGLVQAERFSWHAAARQTVRVYERALGMG
jgi:glycosyltransferase involved in cell wall biosynthesis